jgi:hypothetical protein
LWERKTASDNGSGASDSLRNLLFQSHVFRSQPVRFSAAENSSALRVQTANRMPAAAPFRLTVEPPALSLSE